jgi:hypothetical protein
LIKNVFSTYFQNIKEAIYDNDTKQTEKLLKDCGLSNSRFKAVESAYWSEYMFLLTSVCGAAHDKKLDERTAKIVYDYVASAIEARKFLTLVDKTILLKPSEHPRTAPREIIESLHNVNSRKDIQKKIEELNREELENLISNITSNPNLKISYELIRSIMRAILANKLFSYITLNALIFECTRTTAYTS